MADLGPRAQYDEETDNTVIDFGEAGTLTLQGIDLDDLTDDDFIFNPKPVVEAGADGPGIASSHTSLILSESNGGALKVDTTGWNRNASTYDFVETSDISWSQARATALSKGGYLANITSAAEQNFIYDNVTDHYSAWIGASDSGVESQWRWVDGPEAGLQFWQGAAPQQGGHAVGGAYNAWWQDPDTQGYEPNDAGGNEDYAYLDSNGVWTDLSDQPSPYPSVDGYVVEFTTFSKAGTYGTLVLNPVNGELTYILDNNDLQTQALTAGQIMFDEFDITLLDANNKPVTQHVEFKIIGQNDAPAIHIEDADVYDNEQTGQTFLSGLDVSDADAGAQEQFQVTIHAEHGTLALDAESNVTDGDDSPNDIAFQGTLADIQDALQMGVVYSDPQTAPGLTDKVTLTVEDGQGGEDTLNFIFSVFGENGATLEGTAQKDVIFSTGHNDTLSGAAGNDTFIFDLDANNGIGQDTITDFVQGEDKISIYSLSDYIELGDLSITQQGQDTVITFGTENPNDVESAIWLQGFNGTLTANDFLFHPGSA